MTGDSAGSARRERRDPSGRVRAHCAATGVELPRRELFPVALLRPALADRLRAEFGDMPPDALIDRRLLDGLRTRAVGDLLARERGELSDLEREVVASLERHETLAENPEEEYDDRRTFGERLSDHLASFGGSWAFLIAFGAVLVVWMGFNAVRGAGAFDPYPFILLNLVLSCLAAVQAPVIMMSQRRQEEKDRLRSLNDYRVNLKAELEIRHLHEKIDHILTRQWERLTELQEMQLDLLQELDRRTAGR